jgi:thiol-disulfide isomerase/thioredoxin
MKKICTAALFATGMGTMTMACGAGEEGPSAIVSWVTQPPGLVERGELITASFTVETEEVVGTVGLLACSGAVPECGLTGQDAVGYMAGATPDENGVYTASLEITEAGNWTVVAYVHAGADFISPPLGVVVDKLAYPNGPYGYTSSKIVENFDLLGFKDSDDAGDDPFDDTERQIELKEFFQGEDLDAKVIMINVGAGWCPYCNDEMQYLSARYTGYLHRGIRIFSVVIQDDDENTADLAFAKTWGARFNSKMPTAIDPTDELAPYYPEPSLPLNIFIEAREMKIIDVHLGWSSESATDIFDYYAP